MPDIELVPLSSIPKQEIVDLMNIPDVGRLLPLLRGGFTMDQCTAFLAAKQAIWDEVGYGPYAFRVDGVFAGWGGLQPEQGEADFALILHPDFWGLGRQIFAAVRDDAFGRLNLPAMTILFPPNRKNARAITRAGFVEDGTVTVDGALFRRFRLTNPAA